MTSARPSERILSRGAPRTPRPMGASRPGVRRGILDAALIEFAEKGFQEASLGAIARRLGVTAPLVLYHFGSKANLWREALEEFSGNLATVVDQAVAEGAQTSGREAFRLVVRCLVGFFASNRAAYRLMRDEGVADKGQAEWFAARNLRPIIDQIELVYDRAVREGELRAAPFETTFFMIVGAASCYLESRNLASRLFGEQDRLGRPAQPGQDGEENADWLEDYADQVVGLCFEGLVAGSRRSESPRPMLSALRSSSRAAATPADRARVEAALA